MAKDQMNVQWVDISSIKPYGKNAKKHPDDQVQYIANSLQRFGFRQALVLDKDNIVVVGHGRLLAAKSLGMTEVPAVYADDLTEEEIKAYRLADNKTNESEWDDGLLDLELDELAGVRGSVERPATHGHHHQWGLGRICRQ